MGKWASRWGSAEREVRLSELDAETWMAGPGVAAGGYLGPSGGGCQVCVGGLWRGLGLLLSGRGTESRLENRGGNRCCFWRPPSSSSAGGSKPEAEQ